MKADKPTNPKDAVGSRKARWFTYLPARVMIGIGLALLEGARKYGRHNYRDAGVRASVYIDAAICGHLTPWWEGEDLDPDSGLSHIDKAIASLIVLRDGMYEGNWVDDRPPSNVDIKTLMTEAHRQAGDIIDRYPVPLEPHTRINPKGKHHHETSQFRAEESLLRCEGASDPERDSKAPRASTRTSQIPESYQRRHFSDDREAGGLAEARRNPSRD